MKVNMKVSLKNFLFLFLISALLPDFAFGEKTLGHASDCKKEVESSATMKWAFKSTGKTGTFRSLSYDEALAVEDDTEIYDQSKKAQQEINADLNSKSKQKWDSFVFDKEVASLNCGLIQETYESCKGKTLQDCNKNLYDCLLKLDYEKNAFNAKAQAEQKYKENLIKKICNQSSEQKSTTDTTPQKTSTENATPSAPESNQVYKKQGPFTKALKKCDTGSFMVYKDYSGQSKQQNEAELQEWQNACTSLANCRRASEMTWKVAQGDKIDTYTCVPKKCLPDFPINEDGWCEQIPEKRLEYKNQGPFPKSACYNGPFNLYHYYTGTPKMYNNDELKLWQKSCEKLADCKHASKMTWDIVKGDTFDTYSCVPKTCLPDYPKKEKSGCEKDAENEQQQKDTDAKKIEQKINAAVSRGVKPGDEINLESVSSDATVVNALSKWKKSCTQAKAEHAKKIEAVNTGNVHSCKITSCDKGYNTSDGKQCTPDNRESSVSDAAQKAIVQIDASINHGVKVGSSINVGAVADESDVAAALDKWEKACRKSTRPEGAQRIDVIPQHGYGRQCVITSCDEKKYTLSADNLSCVKNSTEPDKTEEPKSRSRKEQEEAANQKKEDCTNRHGDFKLGKCWCGAKALSDGEDCDNVKQDKENNKNEKESQCEKQHGDFKLGKCWCGAKVLSDGEDCDNIKQDKENDKIQKETDKNEKEIQCEKQHGDFKLGKCWCGAKVLSDGEDCDNIKQDKENDKIQKETDKNQRKTDKAQKESQCENEQNGKFKLGKCWCGVKVLADGETCDKNEEETTTDEQKKSSNKNIQGYIDKIKSIIATGVKVGDEFDESDIGDLYALPNNAEYTKAYDELKAACKNATKPDNAKDLNWQPASISPSKKPRCIIASCETNWYPSKNETECESEESVNAQRKERCEGRDATFNEEDGNCYCKGKLWAWDNDKIWNKNKKCKEKKSNDDNDEDDENEANDSASDKQFLSDVDEIIDAYKEKVKELTKKSK